MSIFESLQTLFTHLVTGMGAITGRDPETNEWTPGRWSGYIETFKDNPLKFRMVNECDGGDVTVELNEDSWGKLEVTVSKRHIISTDDEMDTRWNARHKIFVDHPSSEQQIEHLLFYLAELHGGGIYSDFIDRQVEREKIASLERKVQDLEEKRDYLQRKIRQFEEDDWY